MNFGGVLNLFPLGKLFNEIVMSLALDTIEKSP
jgi:hypothetical protein